MNILCIANSFAEDSTKYLYDMAHFVGQEHKIVNLYIGGCCLQKHHQMMEEERSEYSYQLNGHFYGRKATFKEVLLEDEWDIVTLQQCSGYSGLLESYEPYFGNLLKVIHEHCPGAEVMIHQTWAYEEDSNHKHFHFYNFNQQNMYNELKKSYRHIAKKYNLSIIPFGDLIQYLRQQPEFDYKETDYSLCRDGFHMELFYGRYALAALWFHFVMKGALADNQYVPQQLEGVPIDMKRIKAIKCAIQTIC